MSLSPGLLALLNAVAVLLLLAANAGRATIRLLFINWSLPWPIASGVCLAGALVVTWALGGIVVFHEPLSIAKDKPVRLNSWVGQPLPILSETSGAASLAIGNWEVLIVRPSCSRCETVLAHFLESRRCRVYHGAPTATAIIEIAENSSPTALAYDTLFHTNYNGDLALAIPTPSACIWTTE